MTIVEVYEMLKSLDTNIPVAYDHFTNKVATPCIVFNVDDTYSFFADDTVYYSENKYQVVLTTDIKNPTLEASLETIFNAYNINFEKQEGYINEEYMYQIIYNF